MNSFFERRWTGLALAKGENLLTHLAAYAQHGSSFCAR